MRTLPLFLALAACSSQPGTTDATNDTLPIPDATPIAAATPIATQPAAASTPLPAATPAAPGTPGGLPDDRTPVSEAPFSEDSAQGAATVVQTYYALIGEGKYGQAYRLWEAGAAGMSPQAFAASFDRYAEYHAQIGAPGRVDAGAGQRYVTVPVQVYGRLKADNRPFNLRGSITLHRTADIDGASAEQRRWHIRSSDMKPRPGEATPAPPAPEQSRSTARYRCMDGSRLVAAFDPANKRATLSRGGKQIAVLRAQPVASGISYAGGGYALRGKGLDATFTAPGLPPIACRANN